MRRGRLSLAIGPRGSRGEMGILRPQNLVNDDWVQSWGVVPGPVVVQVAVVPGRSTPTATTRVTPLAAPAFTGNRSGAQANAVKSASIVLIETAGNEARPPSLPTIRGGTQEMRWWPRVRVPWATWSPALWLDPTAVGQLWVAYFQWTWEEGER